MCDNKPKKTKIASSPSFLDRAGGFYGRLDETEAELGDGGKSVATTQAVTMGTTALGEKSCGQIKPEPGVFHFNRGMMEDDGTTTLLRKKPSRWSRRSSRKVKAARGSTDERQGTGSDTTPECGTTPETQTEGLPVVQESEPLIVHFSIREEADDRALIRGQKCDTEVKEKKKGKENQGEKSGGEQMKIVKRSTLKLYRKAIDRAFRRGWETFITSLYSVSLNPVMSTPATSSSVKAEKNNVLIDYN